MDRRTTRRLLEAIREENARAFEGLRIKGHKRPHFLSHLVRHREEWTIEARFGALSKDLHTVNRTALVDARVGSYQRDQVTGGGLQDNSRDLESYDWVQLPFGGHKGSAIALLVELLAAAATGDTFSDDASKRVSIARNILQSIGALSNPTMRTQR